MYRPRISKRMFAISLATVFVASIVLSSLGNNLKSVQASSSQGSVIDSALRAGKGKTKAATVSTVQPTSVNARIASGANDVEQKVSNGYMYFNSSDLELTNDPGVAKDNQSIGLRFTGVSIPKGATITRAYLEFTVDETSSETTSIVFNGQAADNAAAFSSTAYDVSKRSKTSASVSWNNIPAWTSVGAKLQSPDLSGILQEIVKRTGWASGNSLVILINGSGRRVARAYESGSSTAPLLHIEYLPAGSTPTATVSAPTPTASAPAATATATAPAATSTLTTTSSSSVMNKRVSAGADDAEQRVTDGFMYLDSSDLELIYDPGVTKANQNVGMRFTSISIPKGSKITRAYLEFKVDETSSEATSLVLSGQAADNAAAFSTSTSNISSRPKTGASVNWSNLPTWGTVGATIQSPDISPLIQEIVNRAGWASGNSLAIFVNGSGRRVAAAYESGSALAPLLHVEYQPATVSTTAPTPQPTTATPAPTATLSPTTPPPTATAVPTNTATPTSSQPMPVGVSGSWKLAFDDEFSASSLDTSKWRTCFWWADTTCSIETNKELELYNPQDVLVQNGLLRLRAQKRDMVAWNGVTYHYTSGMVMTGGRSGSIPPEFSFTYGYAEARVKIPAGKGLWPAFWMLPSDYTTRPEIDIMEILGDQPYAYLMNYHYIGGDAGSTWNGPDFSTGWHVIGLDWEPGAIVWYVDGKEVYRYTAASTISSKPSYLLLDLAVGGTWPGSPDSSTVFPSYFDVDYVRVWQK